MGQRPLRVRNFTRAGCLRARGQVQVRIGKYLHPSLHLLKTLLHTKICSGRRFLYIETTACFSKYMHMLSSSFLTLNLSLFYAALVCLFQQSLLYGSFHKVSIDMLFASLPHYASLPASPPTLEPQPKDATSGGGGSSAAAEDSAAAASSNSSCSSTKSSASDNTPSAYEWSSDPELELAFVDDTLLSGLRAHAARGGGDGAEATLRSING